MADITIDRLQIEIEAIAGKATRGLDALAKSLETVKKGLTGIDTSGLDKVHKAVDGINNATKSVSNTSVTPKVNTSNISGAEKKIKNAVEGIQDKLIRLQNLEKAALGGDVSAVTSFKRQATSLQGDIDVVANKLKNLGDTRVKSNAFVTLEGQIEKARNLLDALIEKNNRLYGNNTPTNDSNYVRLQENIQKTSDILDGLIDKQREMIKDGSAYTDPMQSYRESVLGVQSALDGSKKNIDEFSSSSEQASNAFDGSKITSVLSTVASTVKSTTKQFFTLAGKGVRGGINAITKSFVLMKNAVSGVRDQISKLTKWTDKGFMKVLKYGFGIRSLYVGFRRLRKAVVASFGELQKSGAFYETTKENIENLKNSLNLLKYQFGAAFEPIFNEVAPALNVFIQHILKAMNVFSAFTAKLMGKDSYSKAVLDTSAIADNTADAVKAQKELNKQLRGFDELNNLTTSTSNKGKSGKDSDKDDDNITYVTESVDNVLGDFGKELAKNIREGNWNAVGTAIGEKLTEQLNSINWSNLKTKAAKFGTDLADFMNGLISPDLFGAFGNAVGEAINTGLTASLAFAEEFDWKNLGTSVGNGINKFVATNPLKLVVKNFNAWANGILDALNSAVETVDWKTIGQHIADGIAAVDAWNITWKLGKLVNNFANAFKMLVGDPKKWENLGDKIAEGINGFFAGMDVVNKETGLNGWQALGQSISDTISGIADAITVALEKTDWEAVGQGIADFISNIDWKKVIWSLGKMLEAFWEAFKGILKGAELDAKDIAIAIGGIALVINTIAGIKLASTITSALLGGLIQKAIVGLLTGGGAAGATAGATAGGAAATSGAVATVGIGSVLATVTGVTVGVAAAATIGWQFGKTFGDFIATFLSNKGIISKDASDEYMAINEMSITQKIKDIKLAAETGNLKKGWDMMWDEWFEPLFSEGRQIAINVKNFALKVAGKATTVKEAWTNFWGDIGEDVFDKTVSIKAAFEDTKETIAKKWEALKTGTVEVGVTLAQKFGNGITTVGGWLKSLGDYDYTSLIGLKKDFDGKKGILSWLHTLGESDYNSEIGLKKVFNGTKGIVSWLHTLGDSDYKSEIGLKKVFDGDKGIVSWLKKLGDSDYLSKIGLKKNFVGTRGIASWLRSLGESDVTSKISLSKAASWAKLTLTQWLTRTKNGISTIGINLAKTKAWKTVQGFIIGNPLLSNVGKAVVTIGVKLKKVGRGVKALFGWGSGDADGGIHVHGKKYNIPQYASGTADAFKHGSVFVAGESGPEVAGHINGRTEILNRSQLASIMYTSITRGMAQFKNAQMFRPEQLQISSGVVNGIANGMARANDSEAMQEQNRLLEEQNRLLRQILNKPTGITSRDVFNATRAEAQSYNNRTGNSPFIF